MGCCRGLLFAYSVFLAALAIAVNACHTLLRVANQHNKSQTMKLLYMVVVLFLLGEACPCVQSRFDPHALASLTAEFCVELSEDFYLFSDKMNKNMKIL